jgi:hypothetical protein
MSESYPAASPSSPGPVVAYERPGGVQPPQQRWSPGRVASLICGMAVAALAAVILLAGTLALVADRAGRDSAGYLTSGPVTLSSDGYALTSDSLELGRGVQFSYPRNLLGDLRFRVTSTDPTVPVFVGMAPTDQVERYLSGVRRTQVSDLGDTPRSRTRTGGGVPADPAAQSFWTARSVGTGTRTLTWTPEQGSWTLVVMRADPAQGLAVRADAGADVPVLTGIWIAVLIVGSLLLILASALIAVPVLRAVRSPRPVAQLG